MKLRCIFNLGAVAIVVATPTPTEWKQGIELIQQNNAPKISPGSHLIKTSPTETKWVTEEELSELLRVRSVFDWVNT